MVSECFWSKTLGAISDGRESTRSVILRTGQLSSNKHSGTLTSQRIRVSSGWISTPWLIGSQASTSTGTQSSYCTAKASSIIGKRKTCWVGIACLLKIIPSILSILWLMQLRQLLLVRHLSAGLLFQNCWSCTKMAQQKMKRIQKITWLYMSIKIRIKGRRSLKIDIA